MLTRFLLFVCAFVPSLSLALDIEHTCGQLPTSKPLNYCISRAPSSQSRHVVYYLHGAGGDQNQWSSSSQTMYQRWQETGAEIPVVVAISFGPVWLLVEKNSSPHSGWLNLFYDSALNTLEPMIFGGSAEQRTLLGFSMGGFNTAEALAKLPAHTFSRAALVCPGMVDLSPWATSQEIQNFVDTYNADRPTLTNLMLIAKAFVPDQVLWETQTSPFVLIDPIAANTSQIFVATNSEDFTFVPGGASFAQQLQSKKSDVIYEAWPGPHCAVSGTSLADFLVK